MLQNKNSTLDFSGQPIYVGIDVHNKMWKVCISFKGMEFVALGGAGTNDGGEYLSHSFPNSQHCVKTIITL